MVSEGSVQDRIGAVWGESGHTLMADRSMRTPQAVPASRVHGLGGADPQFRPTHQADGEGRGRPEVGDVDDAGGVPAVDVARDQAHPLGAHAPKDRGTVRHVADVGVDEDVADAMPPASHHPRAAGSRCRVAGRLSARRAGDTPPG